MVAPTHRFSPFDQRQTSSLSAARKAPGRSAASPGVVSAAGRTPHIHGEQHDDATSQAASSTVGGRLVPDADARWMASAVPVADDLARLAGRLERGAREAGRLAGNVEVLAARLQREMPLSKAVSGVTYAASEQAEHAQLLADAHAVVVRMAAYPEILDVLSALEQGAEVIVRTAESHASSPSHAAGVRSCKTGAVGGEHNPTLSPRKLWSGLIDFVFAGHRKSSSPAHHVCPPVREQITTDDETCASKNSGYRNQGRRA